LKPLLVSKKRRTDADEVLKNAIIEAFRKKGLKHSPEQAEIEVQYSFGVEDIQTLALEPINHESDQLSEITPDSDQDITLLINIIDKRFNRDVWRLQAKQRATAKEPNLSQEEINAVFLDLLQDYPQLA